MKKTTHVRTPLMSDPDAIARIREMWEGGYSIDHIARSYRTTWPTIKTITERLGLPERAVHRVSPPQEWTPKMVTKLRDLWDRGLSGSNIAVELGFGKEGKNKVLGKVHRLGLSGRPHPVKMQPPAATPRKTTAPKPMPLPAFEAVPICHEPIRTGGHIILETGEPRRFLADGPETDWPEPGKCQYPHGKSRPWRFCGRVAVNGSWCEKHFDIVYQKTRTEGYEPIRWVFK
jgi:GcrA cell cycle regulator